MDVEKEIEFFSNLVSQQGDYDPLSESAYVRVIKLFERLTKPRPGEACLDLGAGTGAFTRRLSTYSLKLSGMDICPAAINLARKVTPGVDFFEGDIRDTGLAANSFDIVVYSGVLHHFSALENRLAALCEGKKVLKPGGRLFAFDPNLHSPAMRLYRSSKWKGQTASEILLSRRQLGAELAEAGFSNIHIEGLGGITLRSASSKIGEITRPFYNIYEQAIRFSPFQNALGTYLVSFAVKPSR